MLKKAPYDATELGDKIREVRRDSAWIRSRLLEKHTGNVREYDVVRYRLGYKRGAPECVRSWGGAAWCEEDIALGPYRNGFSGTYQGGVWVIVSGQTPEDVPNRKCE